MRCKKRIVKIAKAVGEELSPVGISLLKDVTEIVANTDWTNDAKRETGYQLGRASLKRAGIEASESSIRLAQETVVKALKAGQDALADIGAVSSEDIAGADSV